VVVKIIETHPPREFKVGSTQAITLKDCARVALSSDEQVTFTTESGGEYDVVRKSWGFYATPSLNGRLSRFGLRGALVRSAEGMFFVFLVESGRENEAAQYMAEEGITRIHWLDDSETLESLAAPRMGET
jgi:hypothetical protein